MSADDYKTYALYTDIKPRSGREEPGQLCVYNTDCHPDSSCISNKCVPSMNLPAVMPFASAQNARSFGTQSQNGGGCLNNADCTSGYCNQFTCMNRNPNYAVYSASSNLNNRPNPLTQFNIVPRRS